MPIRSRILVGDQPRERLLRQGVGVLSDAELVALVAGIEVQGPGDVAVGNELIVEVGGLRGLAAAFPEELTRSSGIGPAEAARLLAAFELVARATTAPLNRVVGSAAVIAELVAPLLARERREKVVVLVADAANRLLRVVTVATGGMDSSPLPVREVLHAVLRYDGRAFALAHNHPSGDPTPSAYDREATQAVGRAADAVGLRFLDHVVVAGTSWCREAGRREALNTFRRSVNEAVNAQPLVVDWSLDTSSGEVSRTSGTDAARSARMPRRGSCRLFV
jgi:DNA repair protein RadC